MLKVGLSCCKSLLDAQDRLGKNTVLLDVIVDADMVGEKDGVHHVPIGGHESKDHHLGGYLLQVDGSELVILALNGHDPPVIGPVDMWHNIEPFFFGPEDDPGPILPPADIDKNDIVTIVGVTMHTVFNGRVAKATKENKGVKRKSASGGNSKKRTASFINDLKIGLRLTRPPQCAASPRRLGLMSTQ